MLQKLSGTIHQVVTSVTLKGGQQRVQSADIFDSIRTETMRVETNVRFRDLTLDDCENYWRTGEPADKAGSYGIQGLGVIFVERLEGSYSNVVGLPLKETAQLLLGFGVDCLAPVKKQLSTLAREVIQHG